MNRIVGVFTLFASLALVTVCSLNTDGAGEATANRQVVPAKSTALVESNSAKRPGSALYFIDSKNGWALANDRLYATVDGGTSWTKLGEDNFSDCEKVVFANQKSGWILCDRWTTKRRSNSILATQDGGHSWREVLEMPTPIFALNFLSQNLGYVSSRWQPFQKTLDGGKSWTQLDGHEGLNYVYFVDEKKGWGYGGGVWQTNDGGKNWKQSVPYDQVDDLWSASFVNATTGWIVGGRELWRTTDGEKWLQVSVGNQNGEFIDVDFINANEGWICVSDGSLLHSDDGGSTWKTQTKLSIKPGSLRFVTNLNGWILGANNELMRSDDGGQTWKRVSWE